jgi:uncharacterized protein (DUF488 family)
MTRQLFTAGYEGTTIDEFVDHLKACRINCVLDVRYFPFSRKPGFSKTKLSRRLTESKIKYIHLGDLGAPKKLREDLKSTGNYSDFFKKMDKYLSDKSDAIEEAYHHVMHKRCCLICFERLSDQCHRKIVARKIKIRDGNGLQVKHI